MKKLPNFLSLLRLACAPAMMVAAAGASSRRWFLVLFGLALLTDALDGALARQLHAQTELGRRLDSWGDCTTMAAAAFGLWLLWPDLLRHEWPWFAAGLGGYFAIIFYGLLRWRKVLGYHTWTSKVLAVAMAVTLALLLLAVAAWPFRVVMALQVAGGIEELLIALLLPRFSGEMPTVWHAWRRKKDAAPPLPE